MYVSNTLTELHDALLSLGLTQSQFDPTLYFLLKDERLVCAVSCHVDDLAIVGEDLFVSSIISDLSAKFKVSSNKELHHFLSISIARDIPNRLLYLSQTHYIESLQVKFLDNVFRPAMTPTDEAFKDLKPRHPLETRSPQEYPSLVGSLLWVAQCTRPDISFCISRLSQFLRDPSISHWEAGLRVLCYLVTTKDLRLRLGGSLTCSGFSDADWAEDRHDRRSTSGYTYCIGVGPISWKSRNNQLFHSQVRKPNIRLFPILARRLSG